MKFLDFQLWIKIGIFHLHAEPGKLQLIRIKGGIFTYFVDWKKPEPKPKKQPIVDDDENSEPIPF